MANLSLKRDAAKKDMNFFAEFTASSRRMQRYLGYAVVAAIAIVAVMLFYAIFLAIRNSSIKSEIEGINTKLNSPEYLSLQDNANALALQMESRTSYYYALTSMRSTVDAKFAATTNLVDILESSISDDMLISSYSINNGQFIIQGKAFSYYRPLELNEIINNAADVFSTTEPTIERFFDEDWKAEELVNNVIQNYYTFEIKGILVKTQHVLVKNIANVDGDFIPLTGITDYEVKASENPSIPVDNIVIGNSIYEPTQILVNGTAISDTEFANAIANKALTLRVYNDSNTVEIDYQLLQTTDGGEG